MQDARHAYRKTVYVKQAATKPLKASPEPSELETRLEYGEKRDERAHRERMFRLSVLAGMIAAGLCFMAAGIPGGEGIAISGGSLLAGHSLISKFGR